MVRSLFLARDPCQPVVGRRCRLADQRQVETVSLASFFWRTLSLILSWALRIMRPPSIHSNCPGWSCCQFSSIVSGWVATKQRWSSGSLVWAKSMPNSESTSLAFENGHYRSRVYSRVEQWANRACPLDSKKLNTPNSAVRSLMAHKASNTTPVEQGSRGLICLSSSSSAQKARSLSVLPTGWYFHRAQGGS